MKARNDIINFLLSPEIGIGGIYINDEWIPVYDLTDAQLANLYIQVGDDMVFALANNSQREYFLKGNTEEDCINKINDTVKKFPMESQKYLHSGIKLIAAGSLEEAKKKFEQCNTIESTGQISFI